MGGANALTQVLYDPRGSFLGSSANPLGASSKAYAQWNSSQPKAQDTVQAFVAHYVNDMLSPDSFTQEIDDAAALQLLEDLQTFGDVTRKYTAAACSGGNAAAGVADDQLVLPSVKLRGLTLSPGGIAGINDEPGGQRIDQGTDSLTCQQAMTPERAFQRLKRAVQIKESGGMDCSKTGCAALAQNPAGTPASYGSTQFVVSTFVDRMLTFSDVRKPSTNQNLVYQALFNSQANLNDEEKKALGLIDAQGQDTGLRQRLDQALQRAVYVLGGTYKGKRIVGWRTRLTANTPIDPASDSQVQQFAKETGFSHTPGSTSSEAYGMYVRMVKWAKMFDLMNELRKTARGSPDEAYALLRKESLKEQAQGVATTKEQQFDALLANLRITRDGFRLYLKQPANWNEGWQGFASAAVFTDKTLKAVLLDAPSALFKSRQKFDLISDREIRWKYAAYRIKYPDETEEDIVARIGYFHNAGSDATTLSMARNFEYAKGLVGIWSDTAKMPCDVMNAPRLALDPIKPKQ
ncbi:hypothetical protein JNX00_06915 [Hydrogenophaga sp. YM1]|uniref:hypothetical protein n=1 Tax=Hydrogenophaga sp. YM1 TaxID=2806262 RepID=UPI00195EBDE2|nr:hypothetical protein [Hydrogenophaga sp. YM1]QRR35589.1 hypothetical protein JNX00_06915 [Hydrogenophaga sp. YM1]